jgi:hypothetical protein
MSEHERADDIPGQEEDLASGRYVLQLPFHGECLTVASSVAARSAAPGYGE